MSRTDTPSSPRSSRTSLRWLAGLAAAAAVTIAAPAAASAQTDEGPYVSTTLPSESSLDLSGTSPVCIRDAPYIQYSIVPIGFVPTDDSATMQITSLNGEYDETVEVTSLTGTIIYPGAEVDENGNGIKWPGWTTAPDGSYIPDPSTAFLRDGLILTVTVNPTASTRVSYVLDGAPCANPTNGESPSTATGSLPQTGGSGLGGMLGMGAIMLIAGGAAVYTARQRRTGEAPTAA